VRRAAQHPGNVVGADVMRGLIDAIKDLHKAWMKDAAYRKQYDALGEELTVMAAIAKARRRAGLSQAELARRRARWRGSQKRRDTGSRSVFSR
jgi:hypothetical protein